MSRRTTLKELPGWDQAAKELRESEWGPSGSKMLSHCGDYLRVVGAFVAPPSITSVSLSLLKAMVVGLMRHRQLDFDQERGERVEQAQVIDMRDWLTMRHFRLERQQRIRGDWSRHWTGRADLGGDPEL